MKNEKNTSVKAGKSSNQFKIGIVGPSRVGKTSLVTSILEDAEKLLTGTPISMKPRGPITKKRIAAHSNELAGHIAAGEFVPEGLKGTVESFKFELLIDPGVPKVNIHVDILDYPGGWLGSVPIGREGEWEECQAWINASPILLLPTDATLLMQAIEKDHKRQVPTLLAMHETEDVVRTWAKERKEHKELGYLLICPVKCETYFPNSVTGRRRNEADKLLTKVREYYDDIIEAAKKEGEQFVKVLYCPIETIGCVELVTAYWEGKDFVADYIILGPGKRMVSGADVVLTTICQSMVEKTKDGMRVGWWDKVINIFGWGNIPRVERLTEIIHRLADPGQTKRNQWMKNL